MKKAIRFGCVTAAFVFLLAPVLGQENSDQMFVRYVTTWGEKGDKPVQFKEPQDLSVDPGGFLYVADTGNQRIQKFDPNGRFITEIGGFGWNQGQFNSPVAVSSRNGMDVFVADMYNHRIERYDKDLHYLATLHSSEEWPEYLQFGFPKDVDLFTQGELFCLDSENHRMLKLDVLGNPQRSFGDFDAGDGRLIQPQKFVISNQGNVYVSDSEYGRIVVFDIHGNYYFTFGEGILEVPSGITVTSDEMILVADGTQKRIFVFQKSGGFIGSFEGAREAGIHFEEPVDIAFWRDRVFVLDKKRSVIDVFQWIFAEENSD